MKYILGLLCVSFLACSPKEGECFKHKTQRDTYAKIITVSEDEGYEYVVYDVAESEANKVRSRGVKDFNELYVPCSCDKYMTQEFSNKIDSLEKGVARTNDRIDYLEKKGK